MNKNKEITPYDSNFKFIPFEETDNNHIINFGKKNSFLTIHKQLRSKSVFYVLKTTHVMTFVYVCEYTCTRHERDWKNQINSVGTLRENSVKNLKWIDIQDCYGTCRVQSLYFYTKTIYKVIQYSK